MELWNKITFNSIAKLMITLNKIVYLDVGLVLITIHPHDNEDSLQKGLLHPVP